jgi:hypothetical protein
MKILLPYSTHFEVVKSTHGLDEGKIVAGGIEKFCKDLENNIDGIIPVHITKTDKDDRFTRSIIYHKIMQHDPDIILFNNPWWGKMMMSLQKQCDVTLICVMHEPLVRDIRMVALGNILKSLNESGCHIYFVSPHQHKYHKNMAMRINKVDFGSIKGYINPSFIPHDMPYEASLDSLIYNLSTVGRCDHEKAPFLIHRKLKNSALNSLVMTNDGIYKSAVANKYVENNKHWQEPRYTKRGLPHDEVINNVAKSEVFCSSWPKESWGITVMEALGCGVPSILLTDKSGAHASERVAADPSHIFKIKRSCSPDEFETGIVEFFNLMKTRRLEIADMTREKHTLANWKYYIDKMIDMRYSDNSKKAARLLQFCI